MPKTQSAGFSLAMGNVHTCDFVGFILPFGSTAVCMYTCSLCIYYVCKLKLNMTDSAFYQKVEKKLHIFIIFYNTVFSAVGVATKSVNPVPKMDFCHYARKPWNCDRSFDCERGHHARWLTIFYGPIGTPLVCLVGIIACMTGVVWHVISRERVFLSNTTGKSSFQRLYGRIKASLSKRNEETQHNLSDQQPNESDVHYRARVYRRETMMQAFLYVVVFLCTYGVSIYVAISNVVDVDVSIIFGLLFLVVYPLGGLFNVLVYSRPAILAFRMEHSNYSWCKAFSLVVMAGGANPNADAGEAGGLCCLRRGKDDDAVSKASKIDLRHQGYAEGADKSVPQGGSRSVDKTTTQGDGGGESVLSSVQPHNLSSTALHRDTRISEDSVLLNRNICESSDISDFGGHSKAYTSSITLDIALKSDVIEPSAIATDAFQRAYARVKGLVGEKNSESENDGGNQIAISSNYLSGFSSVPNEDIEQNDSLKHAIDNSESPTEKHNQTRAVSSSSYNLSGFSDLEKSSQIESNYDLEDINDIHALKAPKLLSSADGKLTSNSSTENVSSPFMSYSKQHGVYGESASLSRASGDGFEGSLEETEEDHNEKFVKEKSRCDVKSHASDLASTRSRAVDFSCDLSTLIEGDGNEEIGHYTDNINL